MHINKLLDKICSLNNVSFVGRTTLGTPIPMVSLGNKKDGGVLIVGAVHAREYITAYLLYELIQEYDGDYPVDVIPILNIDGAILSKEGLNELPLKVRERTTLLRLNDGSTDFSLWKANIRGVDINVNFPADWGKGKYNITHPAPANYIGPCPFSEWETVAVMDAINARDYALVIAYHSKGEEVYYGFGDNKYYKKEAQMLANHLGYKLKRTPHSTGGLKDYFTLTTGRLGLPVEVGKDSFLHPYPLTELQSLKKQHSGVIAQATEIADILWTQKYVL